MQIEQITKITSGMWIMFTTEGNKPCALVFKGTEKVKRSDDFVGRLDLPKNLNLGSTVDEKKKFLKEHGAKTINVVGEKFFVKG